MGAAQTSVFGLTTHQKMDLARSQWSGLPANPLIQNIFGGKFCSLRKPLALGSCRRVRTAAHTPPLLPKPLLPL